MLKISDRLTAESPCLRENECSLIKSFYEQLDDELQNFTLPAEALIRTCNFIDFQSINGIVTCIGGLRNENNLFLITIKAYQGRGSGQEVLQRIIQRAKKENNTHIHLTVFKDNEPAIHIYEKYGFRKISSIKVDTKDSYYMIKSLSFKGHFIFIIERFLSVLGKFFSSNR